MITRALLRVGKGLSVTVATVASIASLGSIQGSDHLSPVAGQTASVEGIVTLVMPRAFFLQGEPDGQSATRDGLFIFTDDAPGVEVGDVARAADTG